MKKILLVLIILISSNSIFADNIIKTLKNNWSEIYQEEFTAQCTCLGPKNSCEDTAKENAEVRFSYFQSTDPEQFLFFRKEAFQIIEISNHYLLAGDYDIKIINKSSTGWYIIDFIREKTLFACK